MSIPDWAKDIIERLRRMEATVASLAERLGRLEGQMEMLVGEVGDLKRKVNGAVRNAAQNKGALAVWAAVISAIVGGGAAIIVRVVTAG